MHFSWKNLPPCCPRFKRLRRRSRLTKQNTVSIVSAILWKTVGGYNKRDCRSTFCWTISHPPYAVSCFFYLWLLACFAVFIYWFVQLQPNWPQSHWDHWLRDPNQHKGRECVFPEVIFFCKSFPDLVFKVSAFVHNASSLPELFAVR